MWLCRSSRLIQNQVDRLNLVSREILTGLSVIRAFGTQKHEEERFDDANKALTKTNLFRKPCDDVYDAAYDVRNEQYYAADRMGRRSQYQ